MRASNPTLRAALQRAQFVSSRHVSESLNALAAALLAVSSSTEPEGAGQACGKSFLASTPFDFTGGAETCSAVIDSSAPLDDQFLTAPFIEKDELARLEKAIDSFVQTAKREQGTR
jgi:hypothetical protein